MKLVLFFTAVSALFTAAALPMQPEQGSSSVPHPDHTPKVVFKDMNMYYNDKVAAHRLIIDHYNGLEPGNDQKAAKLVVAQRGWHDRDGAEIDDAHKQYLDFSYHWEDTPISDKIGQTVTVSRDRPPPEPHFSRSIVRDHKPEMVKEMYKKYIALPPEQASRVRSMRVNGDWGPGSGLRQETKFTYHRALKPRPRNAIGEPVTIQRPMSFLVDGTVPEKEIAAVSKRVREEHEKLDETHPLKKANYGVVTQGFRMDGGRVMVGATLYKVKDELTTDSAEEDFKKIGDFHVPLDKPRLAKSWSGGSGPSTSSRTND